VLKDFPLEFFMLHGLGYGRGFSLEPVEGGLLFTQLMEKISAVYDRFFGTRMEVAPFYPLTEASAMAELSDIVEVSDMADVSAFGTIYSRYSTSAAIKGKGFDKIGEI
jgi:hypothetical protein